MTPMTTTEVVSHSGSPIDWPADEERRANAAALARMGAGDDAVRRALEAPVTPARAPVDRWVDEQMFEEDVRAVLQMMRPNRQERLLGWTEHRTGGQDFRVTVSWDPAASQRASSPAVAEHEAVLSVPRMSEVIAALLIGSARADTDASPDQECDAYLAVLGEVARRVEELRGSFA
jgi:hypothetical protein